MSCRQAAGRGGRGSGGWWRPCRKEGCRVAGSARRTGWSKAMGALSTAMAAAQETAQRAEAGSGAGSQSSCLCAADTVGSAGAALAALVGTGADAPTLCSGCTKAANATAKARNALRRTMPFIAKMTGIFTAPLHHARDRRERNFTPRGTRLSRGPAISEQPSLLQRSLSPGAQDRFASPKKQERRGAGAPPVAGFDAFAGSQR